MNIRDSCHKLLRGCLYGQADIFKPYETSLHSKDACELAERLSVKNLLLYHTEDKNIAWRKVLYLEGQEILQRKPLCA